MDHSATIITQRKKASLARIKTNTTGPFKDEGAAKVKLQKDIEELSELQEMLFAEGKKALLVIFQGLDTSGKDSMIKHVMSGINPQGCEVHSFKTPSVDENQHDFLRRHVIALPARGKIGIFNRSYYEDVTISRVHHEVHDKKVWKQRLEEIRNFETYLSQNNYLVLKFFLHISPEEQKQRLLKRLEDPKKHWKFDVSDIREREFWDEYQKAYVDAFNHTSTVQAPWIIVPADQKWSARLVVSHFLVKALESLKPHYPKLSDAGVAKVKKAKKLLIKK
jgi:PPK2 family polyphosphate:nucleotide phosphotransferase